MVKHLREDVRSPLNIIFALESGDIGYLMTGVFPDRSHNVVQGTYVKKGWLDANLWQGVVPLADLPYVVNPDRGFVVSANNFITTSNIKHGISHAFTFPHRVVRISEMLQETID